MVIVSPMCFVQKCRLIVFLITCGLMLNDENGHRGRGHCIECRFELGILILKFIGLSWGVVCIGVSDLSIAPPLGDF